MKNWWRCHDTADCKEALFSRQVETNPDILSFGIPERYPRCNEVPIEGTKPVILLNAQYHPVPAPLCRNHFWIAEMFRVASGRGNKRPFLLEMQSIFTDGQALTADPVAVLFDISGIVQAQPAIGVDMQPSGTHLIFSLRANFQDTLQSSDGNPQTLCHSNVILDRFVDLVPADDKDTAAAQELPANVDPVLMLGRNAVTEEMGKIQNRAKRCEPGFIDFAAVDGRLVDDSELAAFPDRRNVGKRFFHGVTPFSGCAGGKRSGPMSRIK